MKRNEMSKADWKLFDLISNKCRLFSWFALLFNATDCTQK